MTNKKYKKDGYIYSSTGGRLMSLNSDNNKYFAVIAKCGHCGNGYFIPIMFQSNCKDIKTAIEHVKTFPRVQRDKKDCILEAFEISPIENILIEVINDLDPYLKGYFDKDSPELRSRRMMHKFKLENIIEQAGCEIEDVVRTADRYDESMILQRYFAPIVQGNRVIYPTKVNKRQMLDEYFNHAVFNKGIKKGNIAFLSLYYQIYGKNNPLGLVLDGNWFQFKDINGKLRSIEIPDIYLQKMAENGVFDEVVHEEIIEAKSSNVVSPLEKFNRRLEKYNKIKENLNKQPGQ